jgi:hypothetical protein
VIVVAMAGEETRSIAIAASTIRVGVWNRVIALLFSQANG